MPRTNIEHTHCCHPGLWRHRGWVAQLCRSLSICASESDVSLEVMLGYIWGQVGISCCVTRRADLQPIPHLAPSSISPFFSVQMEFFLDESINSIAHTLQTCVIPLEMFEHGVERAAVSPLLGAGWPQNVWDWRCASPALTILTLHAPDPPTDDSTASANKIWTSCFWNVNYLM